MLAKESFDANVKIRLGDGRMCFFLKDKWVSKGARLHGDERRLYFMALDF